MDYISDIFYLASAYIYLLRKRLKLTLKKPWISLKVCLALAFFLLFSACEKECPDGFSGVDCEVRASDSFTGSYEGRQNCGFTDQFIELEILRQQGPFAVWVNFIETPDFILDAYVHEDTLFFPKQWIATPQNNGSDTIYSILDDSFGLLLSDTLRFQLRFLYPDFSNQHWISCSYEVIK